MIPTKLSHLLAGLIPDAQIRIYPDAAHGFLFQYPDEVAAEVNAFLGDDDAPCRARGRMTTCAIRTRRDLEVDLMADDHVRTAARSPRSQRAAREPCSSPRSRRRR